MSGPLSLLGEVLLQGARDFSNRRQTMTDRDRARALALQDRDDERNYQKSVRDEAFSNQKQLIEDARQHEGRTRNAAWAREERLYEERRWDAMKDQAILKGMDPKAAEDPAEVAKFFKQFGPEETRKASDLASIQAAVPGLIKALGNKAPELASIMAMKPSDIDNARRIYNEAYAKLQEVQGELITRRERNDDVARALVAASLQQISETSTSLVDLQNRGVTELEIRARAEQLAGNGASEEAIAGFQKQARDSLLMEWNLKVENLSNKLRSDTAQFQQVVRAAEYGVLGGEPPKDAAPKKEAPPSTKASAADEAAALGDVTGGKATVAPAPAPASTAITGSATPPPAPAPAAPLAAAPAALGDAPSPSWPWTRMAYEVREFRDGNLRAQAERRIANLEARLRQTNRPEVLAAIQAELEKARQNLRPAALGQ